ncbi:DUF4554 domain-containing protein isoform X1 [Takifugu flavidus]|uniref:DUF4554 domain-containing protein isoform X1 n=1 Tax=Takifugu flavidus TaxID=433684 RepID=UPI002544C856|nr:DUF4554 domain-containing protein isoform X1 [Takifugu flavidus]
MLENIQQVLRSLILLGKQSQRRGCKTTGGLLVLLWAEPATPQSLNCSVAAAGSWCTGIKIEALQPVLADLKESSSNCVWSSLQPDPEELCAFTDLYGPLRLLLSFQMKPAACLGPDWCSRVEEFLHTFSLANARIQVHFKFSFNHQRVQREFRGKIKTKVSLTNQSPLFVDVTSQTQPPEWLHNGRWCQGGHPIIGDPLSLSVPPAAMDQGLFGELSMQPFSFLSPNVTVTAPPSFFQNLPAHLDCEELGLSAIYRSTSKDPLHSGGTVYTVEELENHEDKERQQNLPPLQQRLLLFLLLHYNDPFTVQLSDVVATEVSIERHLEDILNNSKQAVVRAFQTEIKKTLKAQNRRKKDQEKLRSAFEVILSSSVTIVSCSSNLQFRNACLSSMKVCDTHELSTSLRTSLDKVISWKFVSRSRCYSTKVDECPESEKATRSEI